MRIGYAIDLHATAEGSTEVSWEHLLEQALHAEAVGFDIVVVPDHLLYRSGGKGDYARDDASVGAWESVALAGALAAATTGIDLGHSMFNMPYRPPALVAHIASTLDMVSGGRYHLGIGSGNSFDYDAIGVNARHRADRFAQGLEIIHGLLNQRRANLIGSHASARDAELVLRGPRPEGPRIVAAAAGPKAMRVAARYADAWNGFVPADPGHRDLREALRALEAACADAGRSFPTLGLTIDTSVDPLDRQGACSSSAESVLALGDLGIDEVRCYLSTEGTHASRMEAIGAMGELVAQAHAVA